MNPELEAKLAEMGIPPAMAAQFVGGFWESPMVSQIAFMARKSERAEDGSLAGIKDGAIEVGEASIGYRLYNGATVEGGLPTVLVFHHGNAELASDMSHAIDRVYGMGCALLAVDYRGFGWSTGAAALKHLSNDADKVAEALPGILAENNLTGAPCVLWGRSIGATCAVQLASAHPALFQGVIVESGLMDIKTLPMVQQMSFMLPGGPALLGELPDPLGTLGKLDTITIPALVLHGDRDEIVPVDQGRACFAGIASEDKTCKIFEGGDHNSLSAMFADEYQEEFSVFLSKFK